MPWTETSWNRVIDQIWARRTERLESLLKRTKIPSPPIKWKTVLWIFTVSCPCSSLTVSNWTLAGRGWHWQSNAEIYIWPPVLQFFSLFTVLISSPHAHKFFKNQSISISIACTLFSHVYSSSINIINILPPKNHTEPYQLCTMGEKEHWGFSSANTAWSEAEWIRRNWRERISS